MLDRFFKARQARADAVSKAREEYSSWRDIANSKGWASYKDCLNKEINNIKEQMFNNTEMTGEELKRIQLALQVYKKVLLIPKKLQDDAKG